MVRGAGALRERRALRLRGPHDRDFFDHVTFNGEPSHTHGENEVGGSGGSLESPGPLLSNRSLEAPGPLLIHLAPPLYAIGRPYAEPFS